MSLRRMTIGRRRRRTDKEGVVFWSVGGVMNFPRNPKRQEDLRGKPPA